QHIEAYLRGKLSKADQEFFEHGIQKDPLLQNELSLQKDIITSLKEHRKADLKRRLNAIEIKSPWYYSTPLKIAASITAVVVVTLLSFIGFNSSKKTPIAAVEQKEVTTFDSTTKDYPKSEPVVRESTKSNQRKLKETKSTSEKANKKATGKKEKEELSPNPIVPTISENYNEEDFNPEHTLKIPEGNVIQSSEHKSSDIQVQIASTTEHKFHYQFFNNKLFLFCDFSSGPYELLELHNKKSRDLYLFYNDSYYEIKHNQQEVTPLKEIRNSNLIKQLSIIKDK
ncbi:MAG TPA: hypothetical protein VF691_05365, partial [Cytophagaceae bacterium]